MKQVLPPLSDFILLYLSEAGSAELCMLANEVLGHTRTLNHPISRIEFEDYLENSLFQLHRNKFITFGSELSLEIHYPPPNYQPRFQVFGVYLKFNAVEEMYDRLELYTFVQGTYFVITQPGLQTQQPSVQLER
jgi:hypothetical protein